ncbi:sulfatase family protein [Poriferisphaera sp. WC338]|uniref:sulfatase family protein n=1 Tax=Poriferisphaera sp. WC338 TaxID=3425129 RepID=UPI003D814303
MKRVFTKTYMAFAIGTTSYSFAMAESQSNLVASSSYPNVVVIFADDIGYGDLGCYGGKIPTPNIDRLAHEGMRFTDAHSAASLCAPSRYSMLTGNNPYRNGRPGGSWNINHSSGFSLNGDVKQAGRHITAAEILQRAGYRTAFFGKMHLGGTVYDHDGKPIRKQDQIHKMDYARGIDDGPNEHGFDYSFALPSGVQHEPYAFFENGKYVPINQADKADNSSTRLWTNGKYHMGNNGTSEIVEHPVKSPGRGDKAYDSSQVGIILSDKAIAFIDQHQEMNRKSEKASPFLLYYASQAIHVPHSPPLDFDGDSSEINTPVEGVTGGETSDMVYELDLQVGKIIDKLEEEGLRENTMIIFTSDNGALWPNVTKYGDPDHDNNGVFRDYKASVYEGGHRVPMIVSWKNGVMGEWMVEPGSTCDQPVITHDWVATMYELTNQNMDADQAMDSASLMPIFRDPRESIHNVIIYQDGYAYDGAIRQDDWVLLVDRENKATELYDLKNDIGQKKNLINESDHKQRIIRMKKLFLRHNDHKDQTFNEPRTTKKVTAKQ